MMNNLKRQFHEIDKLIERKEYEAALDICEKLLDNIQDNARLYSKYAFILVQLKRNKEAIAVMDTAIALEPVYPGHCFMQGLYGINAQEFDKAIETLSQAIKLEMEQERKYFTITSLFFRAEAYVKTGQYQKALDDIEKVPDDHLTYFSHGLRTKADVLNDAQKGIKSMRKL